MSFNNAILLKRVWNTFQVGDANTFVKLNESFVNKLISVVCADDSDGFVESYLQLFNEFDDNLWNHVLGSQKLHPCKPRIVVDYHKNIHLPIYAFAFSLVCIYPCAGCEELP